MSCHLAKQILLTFVITFNTFMMFVHILVSINQIKVHLHFEGYLMDFLSTYSIH